MYMRTGRFGERARALNQIIRIIRSIIAASSLVASSFALTFFFPCRLWSKFTTIIMGRSRSNARWCVVVCKRFKESTLVVQEIQGSSRLFRRRRTRFYLCV